MFRVGFFFFRKVIWDFFSNTSPLIEKKNCWNISLFIIAWFLSSAHPIIRFGLRQRWTPHPSRKEKPLRNRKYYLFGFNSTTISEIKRIPQLVLDYLLRGEVSWRLSTAPIPILVELKYFISKRCVVLLSYRSN